MNVKRKCIIKDNDQDEAQAAEEMQGEDCETIWSKTQSFRTKSSLIHQQKHSPNETSTATFTPLEVVRGVLDSGFLFLSPLPSFPDLPLPPGVLRGDLTMTR